MTPVDPSPDAAATAGERVDPLSGVPARIVPTRQGRPNLPDGSCPFCPGGLEAPEPYTVRAFPNRWPPMDGDRAEIILYSPVHDADLGTLDAAQGRALVDLWAERSAALGSRDDVAYVLIFENRGPEVGATIAHPHGQLYAFESVPPAALVELTRPDAEAALEPAAHADRLVIDGDHWCAWVPFAAGWPYELLVAPRRAVPDLPSLDDRGRDHLAAILTELVARLDALFDAPMPYMLWIHQRPFDGVDRPAARMHVHIAPLLRAAGVRRFVAAGELGSGVLFNPVDPVTAAAALRDIRRDIRRDLR
ncbi:MAG: galactose-1-phosphate uridylyltransferase [Acidobacteria bacterium]|nr:galactose-1-phosphate uridylyltransferase [Acidobacteriota bacterium]